MELDAAICERARLARDPRFDGRFFIGVHTTGIYCRVVCPVVGPKPGNFSFYASAAAAAEAGLRPCLRCRPEAAPGTPAWAGTSATVRRALRRISQGALDTGSVDALATELGIGPRHLHRLFLQHLGASPVRVAQTRRLHFAKRLLDETQLSMGDIALASGFGSVRRFNTCFLETYGRAPSQLRRARTAAPALPAGSYGLRLAYRAPYDWESLLGFLARRAVPGVEEVVEGRYRRTVMLAGRPGWIEVRHEPARQALALTLHHPEPTALQEAATRVRQMFDLGADPRAVRATLAKDAVLKPLVTRNPGLRIPGAWDPFELGVRAILGQQVSVSAATRLAVRISQAHGEACAAPGLTHLFPTPQALAALTPEVLPLPRQRAVAVVTLAREVAEGRLVLGGAALPEETLAALSELPGMGPWTVQYFALRALAEPDAFPSGDLVLRQVVGGGTPVTPKQLEARAEAWRPWRAYAALHLWSQA